MQNLSLKIGKYRPFKEGCLGTVPKALASKKAILNVKSLDEKCFLWCVLAALNPVHYKQHPNRVIHYKKMKID